MISKELLRTIKQIEIKTRRLVSGSFIGSASSAQKGAGFEFDQIREYQLGDDIRFIDWKSSARTNSLLVKQYVEERNRTIIIAIDISGSVFFGSRDASKWDMIAQIASLLALLGDYGKDQVGLLLFDNQVRTFLPPKRGRTCTLKLIQTIFSIKENSNPSSLATALSYLCKLPYKNAIVFMLSDFIDTGFDRNLAIASRKYELVALRFLDVREYFFNRIGFIMVRDIESGASGLVDTRKNSEFNHFLDARVQQQNVLFKKYGIDHMQVSTDRPMLQQVIQFFSRRMRY